jgi:hypothetical protein
MWKVKLLHHGKWSHDLCITTGKSQALGMKQLSTLIYEKPIAVYALPVTELKDARNTKAKTRKLTLGKSNLFHSILRYYVTVKNNNKVYHVDT